MADDSGSLWKHHKIVVENSVLWPNAFADFYSMRSAPSDAPFVIYFGGAIPASTYDLRRETQPLAILTEFQSAVAHLNLPAADLLVIPNPPIGRAAPDYREHVFKFVLDEMLAMACARMPECLGLLGYSYGAYIAAMLTFELPHVCALATMGGVGMAEAASESELELFEAKRYLCFANTDDMMGGNSRPFSDAMAAHGVKVDLIERLGGHSFADYAENCSARHAFAFLLDSARLSASSELAGHQVLTFE